SSEDAADRRVEGAPARVEGAPRAHQGRARESDARRLAERKIIMRIIVIGATGTIGRAVVDALSPRHDVVAASRSSNPSVDIADAASIRALFASVGHVDAVVCAAGAARFAPLAELTDDDFAFSIANKLMGQ